MNQSGFVYILLAISLAAPSPAFAQPSSSIHKVRIGDSLSRIAEASLGRPVYGTQGSLRKLLSLNPGLKSHDLIFPGQDVRIALESTSSPELTQNRDVASSEETPSVQGEPRTQNAPESKAVVESTNERKLLGGLGLGPTVEYLRLDGTDASGYSASFLSELSPGLSFIWLTPFTEAWRGKLDVDWMHLNMQAVAGRRFEVDHISLAGATYEISRGIGPSEVFVKAGLSQQVFVRSVDAQTLQLERVLTPEVSAGAQLSVLNNENYRAGVRASYGLLGAARNSSFDTSTGHRWSIGPRFDQKLHASEIQLAVDYSESSQSSSQLGEMRRSAIGLSFNYIWMFQ